ncbi:hypothetical protein [Mucilaginibacter sp. HD30]
MDDNKKDSWSDFVEGFKEGVKPKPDNRPSEEKRADAIASGITDTLLNPVQWIKIIFRL